MSSSPYQSSDTFMDLDDSQSWWSQADGNYPGTLDPGSADAVYDDTSRMGTPRFGRDGVGLQPAERKVCDLIIRFA